MTPQHQCVTKYRHVGKNNYYDHFSMISFTNYITGSSFYYNYKRFENKAYIATQLSMFLGIH